MHCLTPLKPSKFVLQLLCQLCDHIGCQISRFSQKARYGSQSELSVTKNIGYYSIYGATLLTELCKAPAARVGTLCSQFRWTSRWEWDHIWCQYGNPEMSDNPRYGLWFELLVSIWILREKMCRKKGLSFFVWFFVLYFLWVFAFK
jgi:hypothetical protein